MQVKKRSKSFHQKNLYRYSFAEIVDVCRTDRAGESFPEDTQGCWGRLKKRAQKRGKERGERTENNTIMKENE